MTQPASRSVTLSAMFVLEFAAWGAYLISMSNYLGSAGLGSLIAWYFAIQGLVCLVTPPLVGVLADRYVSPTRLLCIFQLMAGLFMGCCWYMGYTYTYPDKMLFTVLYTLSIAFFMPTVVLCNTIAFKTLRKAGKDTVKGFPRIRIFGTIGFIAAMIFVNCASLEGGRLHFTFTGPDRFQFQCWQFLVSAILSVALSIYALFMPKVEAGAHGANESWKSRIGLDAIGIFKSVPVATFFAFSLLMGMCLKITNGFSGPYITSFMASPEYADSLGAGNATLLSSLSQASEAFCIMLIPFFMKKFGVKIVLCMSMLAWALRFASLGLGNPGSGLWLLIFSMLVYGIAFDFFNIAGPIYLERDTEKSVTASALGLWMMTTNGIGASVGTIVAGSVIDYFCHWEPSATTPGVAYLVGDWRAAWLIFAGFAAVVATLFAISFRPATKKEETTASIANG